MTRTWKIDGSEQQTHQGGGSDYGTTNQTIAARNWQVLGLRILQQAEELTRLSGGTEKHSPVSLWAWNRTRTITLSADVREASVRGNEVPAERLSLWGRSWNLSREAEARAQKG